MYRGGQWIDGIGSGVSSFSYGSGAVGVHTGSRLYEYYNLYLFKLLYNYKR
ncbi:MAG: hypothetical protein HFJ38_01425 [Bacilli bacterium]|nr:hypothetical protein [Bacilli bacterium]